VKEKMNLLSWILFGVIVGVVANTADYKHTNQIIGWLGVSVLGAVIGGMLGTLIFGEVVSSNLNLEAFGTSLIFAVVLVIGTESILDRTNSLKREFRSLSLRLHKDAFKKV
jgi:uncharacterized membrane protein YeaQ/YmgE (transglycosylase-associated protein family)